jgi:hypothetical protein
MKFKDHSSDSGGDKLPYLKIKDGEKVAGVFKGEIHEFGLIWEGKKVVPIGTTGSSFRFRINFITKEGASYVAKVMEQGATVYNMLKDLNESYPLEETVVEIRRSGSTKDDTRYSILPLPPKAQPTEKGWSVISQTPLVKLKAQASPEPDFDQPLWPDSEAENTEAGELPF